PGDPGGAHPRSPVVDAGFTGSTGKGTRLGQVNRRTKIVSTLGPAVASEEGIRQLVDCGMDVAPLNFRPGWPAAHAQNDRGVRSAAEEAGRAVGGLADLQGPKIRVGRFAEGRHEGAEGDKVAITIADVEGTKNRVSTTYKGLAADA